MSVEEMSVEEMSVEEMSVEEMSVDDHSTLDEELENTDVIYLGTTFQSINQGIFTTLAPV